MKKTIESNSLVAQLCEMVEDNKLTNDDLVELIKVAGDYLNLQTIPDYAKSNGLTYQGVKVTRKIISIFNVKFVVDNE